MKGNFFLTRIIFAMLFVSMASYAGSVNLTVAEKVKKKTENKKDKGKKSTTRIRILKQESTLTISVSNYGESGSFELEWYFIHRVMTHKGKKGSPSVFDKGKETITVETKAKIKKTVVSKEIECKTTKTNKQNKRGKGSGSNKKYKGSVCAGYVVLVRKDGKIVSKKASDSKFLKEEWLEKFTEKI